MELTKKPRSKRLEELVVGTGKIVVGILMTEIFAGPTSNDEISQGSNDGHYPTYGTATYFLNPIIGGFVGYYCLPHSADAAMVKAGYGVCDAILMGIALGAIYGFTTATMGGFFGKGGFFGNEH